MFAIQKKLPRLTFFGLIFALAICTNAQVFAQNGTYPRRAPVHGVVYSLGDMPAIQTNYSQDENAADDSNGEELETTDPEFDSADIENDDSAIEESDVQEDNYQLPRLANVNDPISFAPLSQTQQNDPSQLLTQSYETQVIGNNLSYSDLAGRPGLPSNAYWAAPNFYHRPLIFEERNLERYGNQVRHQHIASAAKFFTTLPLIPYKTGQAIGRREYTLKDRRPGDYVPYEIEQPPLDKRGAFLQAVAAAAIIIP